jgi:hypothetical protein
MHLKKISFLLPIGLLFFFFFKWDKALPLPDKSSCAFCKQSVLDSQKFYEDDLVIALSF